MSMQPDAKPRTVLQVGPRKPGVPSRDEMYRILKERSEQLKKEAGIS